MSKQFISDLTTRIVQDPTQYHIPLLHCFQNCFVVFNSWWVEQVSQPLTMNYVSIEDSELHKEWIFSVLQLLGKRPELHIFQHNWTPKRNLLKNFPPLYINNIQIESVSHFKYLGVWISDDQTWSKHVESICCKARRILGHMFRTFSPHCNQDSIIALYKCQVLPILEYACAVWDPHLKRDQLLLESVQLFATSMAAHSRTSDSESLNHHFQLPSLSSHRTYFISIIYL